MTRSSILNQPRHWLDRAAEARAIAHQMTDAEAKRTMIEIANGYDRLAARAQERAGDQGSK